MGVMKRLMEQQEEQQRVATRIAIEAGVLKRCDLHIEVYDSGELDHSPAYKLGNYKLSHGELGDLFSGSREMTDAVKRAIEDAAAECHYCAKVHAED